MKIRLSVVPQSQVVQELLGAMDRSIDCFSQDRTFDFCLVRVDQFLVPPKRIERFDDACMIYWSKTNVHPSKEAMEQVLVQFSRSYIDENCLHYAAVLYRVGGFGEHAYWGAFFYLVQDTMPNDEPSTYVRVDCRENDIERDLAPVSAMRWLSGADQFSLPCVLAMATKEIRFEDRREPKREPSAVEKTATETNEIAAGLRCFQSGLGEIETLSKKVAKNRDPDFSPEHTRRHLYYGWACAAIPNVLPTMIGGAGQHLEKLFTELSVNKAV